MREQSHALHTVVALVNATPPLCGYVRLFVVVSAPIGGGSSFPKSTSEMKVSRRQWRKFPIELDCCCCCCFSRQLRQHLGSCLCHVGLGSGGRAQLSWASPRRRLPGSLFPIIAASAASTGLRWRLDAGDNYLPACVCVCLVLQPEGFIHCERASAESAGVIRPTEA